MSNTEVESLGAPVTVSTFTTLNAAPSTRVSLWQEYYRRAVPVFRCWPLTDDDLRFSLRRTLFPTVEVVEISGDANLVGRPADLVHSTPSNVIHLSVLIAGTAFFQYGLHTEVLAVGDVLLYDPAGPSLYGRSDGFEEIAVNVSRHRFTARSGIDGLREPRIVRASDPLVSADLSQRVSALRDALHARPYTVDEVSRAVDDLFDLVAGVGTPADHWQNACDYINHRLHDPLLGVSDIAEAVGLSPRQLSRVFAQQGTTAWQVVVDERLRFSHALVTDPAHEGMTIAQIAAASGFSSSSHFARSFRRAYGVSATELRQSGDSARNGNSFRTL